MGMLERLVHSCGGACKGRGKNSSTRIQLAYLSLSASSNMATHYPEVGRGECEQEWPGDLL